MTIATTNQSALAAEPGPPLHRIVVVGGGAGGLELVTRLGDQLGRSHRAEVARPSVEAVAARGRGRQHGRVAA
jgi:hypothetical protein